MVFRFPLRIVCILMGICCCLYGSFKNIHNSMTVSVRLEHEQLPPLIIDPGHGGADGGAIGADGTVESVINLQIAERVNSLGRLCGVPTIMTRDTENIGYPSDANTIAEKKLADQNARLGLIRDYPHGILYSIHQNTYPNESVSGIQVLYGHDDTDREVGILLQGIMNASLCPNSQRAAAEISSDIYLMRNCGCTAVLIECGFISNPKECKLLQTDAYQKQLAAAMIAGYFQYTKQ